MSNIRFNKQCVNVIINVNIIFCTCGLPCKKNSLVWAVVSKTIKNGLHRVKKQNKKWKTKSALYKNLKKIYICTSQMHVGLVSADESCKLKNGVNL